MLVSNGVILCRYSVVDLFRGDGGGGDGYTVGGGGGEPAVAGSGESGDERDGDGSALEEKAAAAGNTVTVHAGVHYDERERVATCSNPAAPRRDSRS